MGSITCWPVLYPPPREACWILKSRCGLWISNPLRRRRCDKKFTFRAAARLPMNKLQWARGRNAMPRYDKASSHPSPQSQFHVHDSKTKFKMIFHLIFLIFGAALAEKKEYSVHHGFTSKKFWLFWPRLALLSLESRCFPFFEFDLKIVFYFGIIILQKS